VHTRRYGNAVLDGTTGNQVSLARENWHSTVGYRTDLSRCIQYVSGAVVWLCSCRALSSLGTSVPLRAYSWRLLYRWCTPNVSGRGHRMVHIVGTSFAKPVLPWGKHGQQSTEYWASPVSVKPDRGCAAHMDTLAGVGSDTPRSQERH